MFHVTTPWRWGGRRFIITNLKTRGGRERAERDRDDGGGEVIDRRRGMEKRLEKVGVEGEGSVVGIEVNEVEGNFQFLQQ